MYVLCAYLKKKIGNKITSPIIFMCPKKGKVRTYLDREPKKSDALMFERKL
jgi:hypothetical protein